MVRIAKTGTSIAGLYECEIKLDDVLSRTGLASVSKREKKKIREELELVLGLAVQEVARSPKLEPGGKLQVKDFIVSLKAVARELSNATEHLRGGEPGIRSSHDVYLAAKVREFLAKNPEIWQSPSHYLKEFCDRSDAIAHACLVAASDLRAIKGTSGNKALVWYVEFIRVLRGIARRHSIRPTMSNSRSTGQPEGRFFELVAAFEMLLYPKMRSPTPGACGKRISRALAKLGKKGHAEASSVGTKLSS